MKIYKKEKYMDCVFNIIDKNVYIEINENDDITIETLYSILEMMEAYDCDIYIYEYNDDILETLMDLAVEYVVSLLEIEDHHIIRPDPLGGFMVYEDDNYIYSINDYPERADTLKLFLNVNKIYIYNIDSITEDDAIIIFKPLLQYTSYIAIPLSNSIFDDNDSLYKHINKIVDSMTTYNINNLFKCNISISDKYYDIMRPIIINMLLKEIGVVKDNIEEVSYKFKLNEMNIPLLYELTFKLYDGEKYIHKIDKDMNQDRLINILRLMCQPLLVIKE